MNKVRFPIRLSFVNDLFYRDTRARLPKKVETRSLYDIDKEKLNPSCSKRTSWHDQETVESILHIPITLCRPLPQRFLPRLTSHIQQRPLPNADRPVTQSLPQALIVRCRSVINTPVIPKPPHRSHSASDVEPANHDYSQSTSRTTPAALSISRASRR